MRRNRQPRNGLPTFAEALKWLALQTGRLRRSPQAGFGDEHFYPTLIENAAVLVVRIGRKCRVPTVGSGAL